MKKIWLQPTDLQNLLDSIDSDLRRPANPYRLISTQGLSARCRKLRAQVIPYSRKQLRLAMKSDTVLANDPVEIATGRITPTMHLKTTV